MVSNQLYTHREMRRFLARAVSRFTPAALIQLLNMDLGSSGPQFRELIWLIINYYCSHFLQRARLWAEHPDEPRINPLEIMRDYHTLWEGWTCTEPYHNSEGRTISYFMNNRRQQRLAEMEAQFIAE